MSNEKQQNEDDSGLLYDLHEKMREIVTGYNDNTKGRCAVCLEDFCPEEEDNQQSFTDRPDLVKINQCYHRFHLICVYRDWFMERKEEIDSFGCKIKYQLPEIKRCPICRREVADSEIEYIVKKYKNHPEVEDNGYQW